LGQTDSSASAQSAQKVHSYEQIRAELDHCRPAWQRSQAARISRAMPGNLPVFAMGLVGPGILDGASAPEIG